MQYAPIAILMLALLFMRTRLKLLLDTGAAGAVPAVGAFDALTWDGGLFHSCVTNVRFNIILGRMLTGFVRGQDPVFGIRFVETP